MDGEDRGRIKNKWKGREEEEMEWKSFRVKRGMKVAVGRVRRRRWTQVQVSGCWGAEGEGGSVQGQE